MRTAEEILMEKTKEMLFNGCGLKEVAIAAINDARKEAIEECAERATVNQEQYQGKQAVNKQSILSLINELK